MTSWGLWVQSDYYDFKVFVVTYCFIWINVIEDNRILKENAKYLIVAVQILLTFDSITVSVYNNVY